MSVHFKWCVFEVDNKNDIDINLLYVSIVSSPQVGSVVSFY